jgi:PAS domain S-box-containing protein
MRTAQQNEDLRLDTLESFEVVHGPPDPALDEITRLAAQVCGVSSAAIAFIGEDTVWYKSTFGMDAVETRRENSPCDETIAGVDLYQIPDASVDDRYEPKGIALGKDIFRFFAGAPLIAPNGSGIGCLCIFSHQSRLLQEREAEALRALSHQVMTRLELLTRIRLMDNEARVRQRVESALTVERNFVSAVLDTAGALVVVQDTAGRVVRFNRACEAVSGFDISDIVGRYLWETLIPHEDRAEAIAAFDKIRSGDFPVAFENRWRVNNGTLRRIQWMATALLDGQNEVAFVIASGIDVTLQREAEGTLRESEARYRQLIEGALGVVFTHDKEGRLISLNSYGAESLGYGMSDVVGHSLAEFMPVEDREDFDAYLQKVLTAGEGQGTFRIRHRDGTQHVIAYRNRLIEAAERDAYVLGFGVDITEKVLAEESLSALTLQSNSILDSVGDGIFAVNLDGVATVVNPAASEMLGYKPEELLGKNIGDMLRISRQDGTLYPHDKNAITDSLRQRTAIRVLTDVFWRKDGTCFPVEFVACPILRDGTATGVVVAFTDETERRALDKMKDEFISTVSHELRTPLTSMRASLGLISSGALASRPEKQAQMLNIAIDNTDRLVNLVNDILELERIGSGKTELHYTMCSAEDLMRRAVGLQAGTASKAGIEFTFDASDVNVWADPDRILQTLTNLISNAIKFSPAGGTIHMKARTLGSDEALLQVEDSGRGIPGHLLESIFERFQQVDASDSRTKGGTGLGLAICRSIVAQHGGRIWAESQLGRGATLLFTLPTKPRQHLR